MSYPILASVVMVLSTTVSAQDHNTKTKYGITVTTCEFDHDYERFCTDSHMKVFAKVMAERQANFAGDRLLYIYKTEYNYRMVSIDKNKKTVAPFYWGFSEAEQPVNKKGDKMAFNFNKNSNKFCYKGKIDAYRNTYDYDPEYYPEFCFDYDKKKNEFGWFKQ